MVVQWQTFSLGCQPHLSSIPVGKTTCRDIPFRSRPSVSHLRKHLAARRGSSSTDATIPAAQLKIHCPCKDLRCIKEPVDILNLLDASRYIRAFNLIKNAACAITRALWPDDASEMMDDLMASGFTFPSSTTLAVARPRLDASAMLCERYEWNHGSRGSWAHSE